MNFYNKTMNSAETGLLHTRRKNTLKRLPLRENGFSVQSSLYCYLTSEQTAAIQPILKVLKKWVQVELCVSLIDYIEGNGIQGLQHSVLNKIQQMIIEKCNITPLQK